MNTPRCDSPTKSESSINWVLSPYKDLHIDKKVASHHMITSFILSSAKFVASALLILL